MEAPSCDWDHAAAATNVEARQFGVGVLGGVELVTLGTRVHHEAKTWLILTDSSNAFNTAKRTGALAKEPVCLPALTPYLVKCYGERSAPVVFRMESGERRKIDCFSGVQQGEAMGPVFFCMPLLPVLK